MKFQIPQFIETEDKVVGPLSLKQAGFLGVGILTFLIIYASLGMARAVILGMPIAAFSFAMAFLQINGRPFEYYLKSFIRYNFTEHIYVWRRPKEATMTRKMLKAEEIGRRYEAAAKKKKAPDEKPEGMEHGSRLADMAWEVNIQKQSEENEEPGF